MMAWRQVNNANGGAMSDGEEPGAAQASRELWGSTGSPKPEDWWESFAVLVDAMGMTKEARRICLGTYQIWN